MISMVQYIILLIPLPQSSSHSAMLQRDDKSRSQTLALYMASNVTARFCLKTPVYQVSADSLCAIICDAVYIYNQLFMPFSWEYKGT